MLQEILTEVKRSLHTTDPDYNLVLDRLHLYYDMQLIIFGIDRDMSVIIQFLVFIQPYAQKPLILYQLETIPAPFWTKIPKPNLAHISESKSLI